MTYELTEKQHEVLLWHAMHMTSKEIAAEAGISPSAVNQRIAAICRRMGVANRREMARVYLHDLINLDEAYRVVRKGDWHANAGPAVLGIVDR